MKLSDISHHKSLARFHIRERRSRQQADLQKTEVVDNLVSVARPLIEGLPTGSTIAAFLPLPSEPPITGILLDAHRRGIRIVVPLVCSERQLEWVQWHPKGKTTKNSLGIDEPRGEKLGPDAFLTADLRFVPALAVDINGKRLGQGGGFYDTLTERLSDAQCHNTYTVVFEHEILDGLPVESHDFSTHCALTPAGIRRFVPATNN